ncbi:hypothetical protein [Sorangium sp. So ce131]|uniref:hypothetical protein n=1 Tax=Sorangium sp. So ce131 TaxID=3133282 RepID=UPI003F62277B
MRPSPTKWMVATAPARPHRVPRPVTSARAYVVCYGEDALSIVDLTDLDIEVKLVPVGPNRSTDAV